MLIVKNKSVQRPLTMIARAAFSSSSSSEGTTSSDEQIKNIIDPYKN